MFDRRVAANFDWTLFILTLTLSVIGVLFIFSATREDTAASYHLTQVIWLFLALFAMLIVISIDYHFLSLIAPLAYILLNVMLLFLLIFGREVSGARSWIDLGFFKIQPSEIMKFVLILTLSRFFEKFGGDRLTIWTFLSGAVILGVPMVLVMLQPDLGTALTFMPILIGMIWITGIRMRTLVVLALIVILIAPIGWTYLLKDYQRDRIITFVHPEADPLGAGYQIMQSKIAIGSGQVFGRGLTMGTQSRLKFLPEHHTDFIVSVVGEETGFAGSLVILLLYLLLCMRLFQIAANARDRLGIYLVVGVTSFLVFHVLVNIGMVVGVMPVTGIPLPLLSYGGSSMISTFLALGLAFNVTMRRLVN
jgi:rod shape determining protein RodA